MIVNNSPAFQANLNSPKLRFKQDDFYVHIRGYGKNAGWANDVKKTADLAVKLIRRDTSAENVLKLISIGVGNANKNNTFDMMKKMFSGVLRVPRENWVFRKWADLTTPYDASRYKSYSKRLDFTASHPLHPEKAPDYSRPVVYENGMRVIEHGSSLYVNRDLDKVLKLSKNIFPKYIHQDVKPENMDEINSSIAEIRWILAHSTPWLRGSDAISNVFMRAMYKAVGIKTYPLKKGISLDLEAYCTELDEYKKKFPAYFENPPEIIE